MKTWIRRTLIGALGATVLLGGLAACGARGHHGDWSEERIGEMRGKAIERVADRLELDAAQKQKLSVLADELLAQRTALRGSQADPRAEFKALVSGTTFDRSGAQALLQSKTQAVQTQGPKVIEALADFYDSLNPQQQQQMREKLERRRGWWHRG